MIYAVHALCGYYTIHLSVNILYIKIQTKSIYAQLTIHYNKGMNSIKWFWQFIDISTKSP